MIVHTNYGRCIPIMRCGLTLLVFLLLAGSAEAKTLTVDDSGGMDYTRIQDAIDKSTEGDTILVYSGTYHELVTVNKPLILRGIDNGKGKPIVEAPYAIILSADNITLDGFETVNGQRGIWVQSNNNVIINNTVSYNKEYGIGITSGVRTGVIIVAEGNRIPITTPTNNTLHSNTVSNNGDGILLSTSHYNTLSNNTVSNNFRYGINIWTSHNNTLSNNIVSNNKDDGIIINSFSNNTILSNNKVSDNDGGLSLIDSSAILRNNIIANNKLWGIYISRSFNTTIYNNIFNNKHNAELGYYPESNWNITKTLGTNIIGGPYLGGNFWADPMGTGFSQTCIDSDGDEICDSLYGLDIDHGFVDYLPLAYKPRATEKQTLIVDDSGGADYTGIQDAINNARAGATILVYSGTYHENVIVHKPLILKGIDTGWGKPIINAVKIEKPREVETRNTVTLSAENSTLDGFKTINGNYGIYVNSNYNIIVNNTVLNNVKGIYLFNSRNNILSNNAVSDNLQESIYLAISSNNIIYNNFFSNSEHFLPKSDLVNNWNITKTHGTNTIGGSYLGGNVWVNPNGTGFSQTCVDDNSDNLCDSSYTLEINNIDQLALPYRLATTTLMNQFFIISVLLLIAMSTLRLRSIGVKSYDIVTATKYALKGVLYGSIASVVVGWEYFAIPMTKSPGALIWVVTYGVFVGAVAGIIGGISKNKIIGAIFGAIGGMVLVSPYHIYINQLIAAAPSVFFGAIVGYVIGRTFYSVCKEKIFGAVVGGIFGGLIGRAAIENIIGGLIGGTIFGAIVGSLIGGFFDWLINEITMDRNAVVRNSLAGAIGGVIIGIIVNLPEAWIVGLIVSLILGAAVGGLTGTFFKNSKYALLYAILAGAIFGGIISGVIGGGAIINAILIIYSKISRSSNEILIFCGIIGGIVGAIVCRKRYCQNCGAEFPENALFCPRCGTRTTPKKNSGIAALLSLIIPGAGQIYCGRTERGIIILIGTVLLIFNFLSFILIGIVVWIWNIYDAYQLAEKINKGEFTWIC